jgi:hypothetical protein
MKVWQQLEGTLTSVDLVNRVAAVQRGSRIVTFDVPPACEVLLRGERVKLRMLQPSDAVTIRYRGTAGRHVANVIEARGAPNRGDHPLGDSLERSTQQESTNGGNGETLARERRAK